MDKAKTAWHHTRRGVKEVWTKQYPYMLWNSIKVVAFSCHRGDHAGNDVLSGAS